MKKQDKLYAYIIHNAMKSSFQSASEELKRLLYIFAKYNKIEKRVPDTLTYRIYPLTFGEDESLIVKALVFFQREIGEDKERVYVIYPIKDKLCLTSACLDKASTVDKQVELILSLITAHNPFVQYNDSILEMLKMEFGGDFEWTEIGCGRFRQTRCTAWLLPLINDADKKEVMVVRYNNEKGYTLNHCSSALLYKRYSSPIINYNNNVEYLNSVIRQLESAPLLAGNIKYLYHD